MAAGQVCRKCQTLKAWDDYYAHPMMASGRDSICKECAKDRARENRRVKADYYRAYDRKRYRDDPKRKQASRECAAKWFAAHGKPQAPAFKRRAHVAVSRALRSGAIQREPCFFCGSTEKLHAHHEDYDLPLDVVWLCASCHGKLHTIKGDFRRAP